MSSTPNREDSNINNQEETTVVGETPSKEMNQVINRIQELEDEYRSSISQRAAKLSEQQDKYSELQTAVESHTRKYKQEAQRLRAALRKSEEKQAVLAKRLAQTLQCRNEDETSHTDTVLSA